MWGKKVKLLKSSKREGFLSLYCDEETHMVKKVDWEAFTTSYKVLNNELRAAFESDNPKAENTAKFLQLEIEKLNDEITTEANEEIIILLDQIYASTLAAKLSINTIELKKEIDSSYFSTPIGDSQVMYR